MTDGVVVPPLYHEVGASWYWLLAGPVSAAIMLYIEVNAGIGARVVPPLFFLLLVSGFLAVQVKAARIHTSVELTHDKLRQGAETIDVASIVRIFPEAEPGGRRRSGSRRARSANWRACRAAAPASGSSSPRDTRCRHGRERIKSSGWR